MCLGAGSFSPISLEISSGFRVNLYQNRNPAVLAFFAKCRNVWHCPGSQYSAEVLFSAKFASPDPGEVSVCRLVAGFGGGSEGWFAPRELSPPWFVSAEISPL